MKLTKSSLRARTEADTDSAGTCQNLLNCYQSSASSAAMYTALSVVTELNACCTRDCACGGSIVVRLLKGPSSAFVS